MRVDFDRRGGILEHGIHTRGHTNAAAISSVTSETALGGGLCPLGARVEAAASPKGRHGYGKMREKGARAVEFH